MSHSVSAGTATPSFHARQASGTGYGGLDRVYQLLHSNDLKTFAPVPGADAIVGDDTTVEVPLSIDDLGTPSFFKLRVWLE